MENTESLQRVEATFMVLAPEGGFRRQLRSFDIGARNSVDVEIENQYGQTMWLRIYPDREEVVLDPHHDELYLFNKASAVFIDGPGGGEIIDKPVTDVWVSINTDVQIGGMPAGTLKMWNLSLDTHHQIGA